MIIEIIFISIPVTAMINAPKKADKSSEEKDSNKTSHGPCFNGMVSECVFKNLYLLCPSKILSTNSTCTDLTKKMTQCPCEHGRKGQHGGSAEDSNEKGGKANKKGQKNGKKDQEGGKKEKNGDKKDNK